jgi:hypothetical protein
MLGNNGGPDGAEAVAAMLAANTTLQELSLSGAFAGVADSHSWMSD